jgi:hypothetical protein
VRERIKTKQRQVASGKLLEEKINEAEAEFREPEDSRM